MNKTHGNTLVKMIELAKRLFFICSPVTKVLQRIVKSRVPYCTSIGHIK